MDIPLINIISKQSNWQLERLHHKPQVYYGSSHYKIYKILDTDNSKTNILVKEKSSDDNDIYYIGCL
jgi:uncharacterized protein YukJ